ncbi:acyl-CoA dehydrogenase family protein, partial [Caballeronia sp. BR00000012568055]|uniref:acyl-CoA dehydrogenase family protein n=1 Tax=Caballeronia sp. BR00000012568055 TaxID=2918761 RepID=UPI0023F61EBB
MSETKNIVKQGPKLVSTLSAEYGFAEIIQEIAATAADRERSHRLPYEEIGSLKAQGFGALRLPVKDGGRGASLRELFVVARDIAAADSNIAHAFRNHF